MLKVVFLINQFHPIIGGAEKQAGMLARQLRSKGLDVKVVTGKWNRKTAKNEILNGIPVHRCFIPWITINGVKKGGSFFSMFSFFFYLFKNRGKYDFIQCFQVLNEAFVALLIQRLLKKVVIARNGSSGITCDSKMIENYIGGRFKKKFIIKNLKYLIGISRDSANGFIDKGLDRSKVYYIPNGVDLPVLKKESYASNNKIIYIGRLSYEKGVDILIDAMGIVSSKYPNVKVDIIGDGPEADKYKALIKRSGIGRNINLLGEKHNLKSFYLNSDIFVLPSRTEGMSNVLLEAMSYGLPCIATAVGGNKEIIVNGENGFLVKPEMQDGLAESVIELIKDQNLRERIGKNARQTIEEKYSIDMIADRYLEFYKRLYNK